MTKVEQEKTAKGKERGFKAEIINKGTYENGSNGPIYSNMHVRRGHGAEQGPGEVSCTTCVVLDEGCRGRALEASPGKGDPQGVSSRLEARQNGTFEGQRMRNK